MRQPGDDENEPPPPDDRHAPGAGGRRGSAAPGTSPTSAIGAAWGPVPIEWLMERLPARRWLLRRPTKGGRPCLPAEGDGLLPLGKLGLLVADGGVGKTMTLLALAISLITGHRWLGYFYAPHEVRGCRVCLLLAEEDREEVQRRLFDLADALELTAEERDRVARQLVVLPMAGMPVALVNEDGSPSLELAELRQRLHQDAGDTGWSLVGLDPFSRLSASESEVDNALATRTIQAAEVLLTAPGGPTVLIAHHAPAASLADGRQVRARGVTGIRNGARWEATLREDEKGEVWFRQSKSNYSLRMRDELRLVRGPRGLLRAATDEEEQDRERQRQEAKVAPEAAREAKALERVARAEAAILDALAQMPALPTSQAGLTALATGFSQQARADAVTNLLKARRILRPKGKGEPYRLASLEGTQVTLGLDPPKSGPEAP